MKLNELHGNPGSHTKRKRVGRGIGSGKGKTAGRGQKGQKSRSGVAIKGFEGGQMPLHMRLPKRGFNNIFKKDYAEANIGRIQVAIDTGRLAADQLIDHAALKAAGIASGGKDGVRILGKGDVRIALRFRVSGVSAGALAAIEAKGGSVDIIEVVPKADKWRAKRNRVRNARRRDFLSMRATPNEGRAPPPAHANAASGRYIKQRFIPDTLPAVEELIALRQHLAQDHMRMPGQELIGSINAVGALMRLLDRNRIMAATPRTADASSRAIVLNAILGDLHRHLLSPREDVAQAAARTLVMTCSPARRKLADLGPQDGMTDVQEEIAAEALATLLFDAGDRWYTSFTLYRRDKTRKGFQYAGTYRVGRALPVGFGNHPVILPAPAEPVPSGALRIVVDGTPAPIVKTFAEPDPASADLLVADVEFELVETPGADGVRISFEVPDIVSETIILSPEDLEPIETDE